MKNRFQLIALRLCLCLTLFSIQRTISAQSVMLAQQSATSKTKPILTSPASATQLLKDALKELENRFGIRFTYNEKTVEGLRVPTPDVSKTDVNRLLNDLLKPVGLTYKRYKKPNTIYFIFSVNESSTRKTEFSATPEASASSLSGQAESIPTPTVNQSSLVSNAVIQPVEFTVKGVVRSETNEGLPGVSVVQKGTTHGTVTDTDGRFSLSVPDGNATLVFSYIGYVRQEVGIKNRANLEIALVPDTKALDEVVVVGYGTQKKSEVTSAITSVKASELLQTPASNLAQGLQGLVAGLQVTQSNAAPGGAISMRIRGTNSINGSSEPLYIIDGVQVQNTSQNIPINTNGGRQIIGGNANEVSPLSNLNPNDIESVEVLKDASAAAIYGSQAANGVVIITTKRGKSGKTKISYESYYGQQQITKTIPVLNGTQFAELENEVYKNPNRFPRPDSIGVGTNWQDQIFRKAVIQNHQLTVSGGNEKTQLLVSFNYFNQDGIVINSSFDRYSLRLNLDHQATNWLKIGTSTLFSKSINQRIPTGSVDTDGGGLLNSLVGLALATPPVLRAYDDAGDVLNFDRQLRGLYLDLRHPLQFTKILDQQHTNTFVPNVYFDFSLLKGLKYRANFNAVITGSLLDYYFPIAASTITDISTNGGGGGFAMKQNQNYNRMMHESIVSYDHVFKTHHTLRGIAGYSYIANNSNYNYSTGQRFASDATSNENIGLAQIRDSRSSRSKDELVSFFGRLSYNFKGKYFIDFNARMDGSSKFGRNNKYALFPAISGAWNVTEESFLENNAFISNLKLRASAGQTGNQGAIGAYQSLATVGLGRDYIFNGVNVTGTQPTGVANPDLRWEKSTQVNVGFDLDLLKNKISLVMDLYSKRTEDLIFARNLPLSSGYSTVFGNFASLENKGLEIALKARPITTEKLKWDVSANIAFNRNKVTKLQDNLQKFDVNFYNSLVVGQPIGLFRTYVFNGIYQNSETILEGSGSRVGGVKVKDVNGDGRINDSDLVLTNSAPNFTYGFSTNLKFKSFYLNALFSGVQGSKVLNMAAYQLENPLGMRNVLSGLSNRWTPQNPSQEYVHAGTNLAQRIPLTDRYIEDGSFLRARNITIGYQLPQIKGINLAKVYISGNNLFTVTRYTGFDPEVNSFGGSNTLVGVDNIVYPVSKSWLVGLQVEF
ncbi:SusC/RagA family TonB-linked outer membrane protein [Spirosoma daeguense]